MQQETCDKYKVKGFPTIKLFGKDKEKKPTDYKVCAVCLQSWPKLMVLRLCCEIWPSACTSS